VLSIQHVLHKPILRFFQVSVPFSLSLMQNFIAQCGSRLHFCIFVTCHYYTHLHNSLSSQTCWGYRVETYTEHQLGM
jgi:hypothetical protein